MKVPRIQISRASNGYIVATFENEKITGLWIFVSKKAVLEFLKDFLEEINVST